MRFSTPHERSRASHSLALACLYLYHSTMWYPAYSHPHLCAGPVAVCVSQYRDQARSYPSAPSFIVPPPPPPPPPCALALADTSAFSSTPVRVSVSVDFIRLMKMVRTGRIRHETRQTDLTHTAEEHIGGERRRS